MRTGRRIAPVAAALILCVCAGIPLSGTQDASCGWLEYRNPQHGFRVCYPAGLCVTEPGEDAVVQAAVVLFVPLADPSIGEAGAVTNLRDLKVAVGVSDTGSLDGSREACDAQTAERIVLGEIEFVVRRHAEGAVGNRYETLSYVTIRQGKRFEIALFLHYGHPDCYSPGRMTPFDSAAILCWFEQMVRSFSA